MYVPFKMLGSFHFHLWSNNFPALNKKYTLNLPTDVFEVLDVRTFFQWVLICFSLSSSCSQGEGEKVKKSSTEGSVGKLSPHWTQQESFYWSE